MTQPSTLLFLEDFTPCAGPECHNGINTTNWSFMLGNGADYGIPGACGPLLRGYCCIGEVKCPPAADPTHGDAAQRESARQHPRKLLRIPHDFDSPPLPGR